MDFTGSVDSHENLHSRALLEWLKDTISWCPGVGRPRVVWSIVHAHRTTRERPFTELIRPAGTVPKKSMRTCSPIPVPCRGDSDRRGAAAFLFGGACRSNRPSPSSGSASSGWAPPVPVRCVNRAPQGPVLRSNKVPRCSHQAISEVGMVLGTSARALALLPSQLRVPVGRSAVTVHKTGSGCRGFWDILRPSTGAAPGAVPSWLPV